MAFPPQEPRPFTVESIEELVPRQRGCYAIFTQTMEPIYVGKGDIRKKLLEHLQGRPPSIARHRPAFWKAIITTNPDGEQKRLIYELDPICNR